MPEAQLLTLIGALFTMLIALVASIYGVLVRRLERLEAANNAAVLLSRIDTHEKDLEGLRDWKHKVVDAYLPRAVDDHHRRLERLERKVFNGHHGAER